jgi:Fe-S cluster biogenesis protein NfuA
VPNEAFRAKLPPYEGGTQGGAVPDEAFRAMDRLDSLLREVENIPDTQTRAHVREMVQAILELHAVGLERMLGQIAGEGEAGLALIEALARDDLVGGLLLLHGLHPLDLPTRVRQALEKVRPYLRSHGGNVELLAVDAGVVRLRMLGSCHGCPSSAMTLKLAIEEAIYALAPEVAAIEVEGASAATDPPLSVIVPLEQLRLPGGQADGRAAFRMSGTPNTETSSS